MIFESTERQFSFAEFDSLETRVMHYLVNHQYEDTNIGKIAEDLGDNVYSVEEAVDKLAGNMGLFNVVG